MRTPIPQLEHGSGSWVCTGPQGHLFEFFDRSNVEEMAELGWKIETAEQYLGRINAEIRSAERGAS